MDVRENVVTVMRGAGFEGEELADDRRIAEDLDIDSTELVEVVVALEQHFGISIDADAEGGFRTFRDLVDCVDRLLSAGAGAVRS
ncbi:acyl carrier protein [Streptomyces sp. NBC_01381]|uniref:acyl carrier protein n=1 Tax=Streptomyces sp. NBC_01381 TaxID=2903845 RepID=UPI002255310B|nr:acyl carrier protein [Streptomyces sp. NBC_01381]MCX4671039.1 acyl carrier protein [Streptomyces sp. NBC_01381]